MDLDLSRAVSTEHLYESISELESQLEGEEEETLPKEHISNSSQDSITGSLKGELNPENELDSGEWSTESASPTFDESSNKDKGSTMNQYRFTVNYESQETAKKTFMNSVLGKKGVNPKKRRMSNFFVPWLVSNQEYGPSKSPKTTLKKQNSRGQANSKSAPCKNKRSRSVPTGSPKLSLSCTKTISSSSELLEEETDVGGT